MKYKLLNIFTWGILTIKLPKHFRIFTSSVSCYIHCDGTCYKYQNAVFVVAINAVYIYLEERI